ncbi:hypothetical protein ES705_13507 [subsurface metagenome]
MEHAGTYTGYKHENDEKYVTGSNADKAHGDSSNCRGKNYQITNTYPVGHNSYKRIQKIGNTLNDRKQSEERVVDGKFFNKERLHRSEKGRINIMNMMGKRNKDYIGRIKFL